MLRDAFFAWQPSAPPSAYFTHPEDPEAAETTLNLERELKELRWRPVSERRRFFRNLILKHHPDISEDKHAGSTIQFLSDVKDWFLAGY